MFLSPIKILPLSGFKKPVTHLKVVVLPHPEGPSSVTSSPSLTSRESPFITAVFHNFYKYYQV